MESLKGMGNNRRTFSWQFRAISFFLVVIASSFAFSCGGGGGDGDGGAGTTGGQGDDPPTITKINPSTGHILGGLPVIITGANFTDSNDTTVTFGGVPALYVYVLNPSYIYCETPPQPQTGAVDVTVATRNGEDTLEEGFTYHDDPCILWLNADKTGNQVDFTWALSDPGDQIIVYRGDQSIATLSGGATTFTYTEATYGYIRYTVALYIAGVRESEMDVLIEFGRALWDPPSMAVSGYCLYIAEAIGDPYLVLPYDNPAAYDYNAGNVTSVDLKDLYDDALIDGGKSYFLAASSYIASYPQPLFSVLTPPLTFDYEVVVENP